MLLYWCTEGRQRLQIMLEVHHAAATCGANLPNEHCGMKALKHSSSLELTSEYGQAYSQPMKMYPCAEVSDWDPSSSSFIPSSGGFACAGVEYPLSQPVESKQGFHAEFACHQQALAMRSVTLVS